MQYFCPLLVSFHNATRTVPNLHQTYQFSRVTESPGKRPETDSEKDPASLDRNTANLKDIGSQKKNHHFYPWQPEFGTCVKYSQSNPLRGTLNTSYIRFGHV